MNLSRAIRIIMSWWNAQHPRAAAIPEWKRAHEAERRARRRNCTRAIGQARKAKSAALHAEMRGKAGA